MKIVFCTDTLEQGGKERQLIENLIELKTNYSIKIIVISFNQNCFYSEIAKKYADSYFEIKKSNKLKALFTYNKLIKKIKPSIIHVWDFFSAFYTFLISPVHSYKTIDGSIRDSGVEKGIIYYIKRFLLKKANVIIANSKEGLAYYKVRGIVIYNAINLSRFKKNKHTDENNIIMVANFTNYKDHKTFIDAAHILAKKNIIDKVYMIGDGPLLNKWKIYIQNFTNDVKKRYIFLGKKYNVEDYLAQCKIGVMCSTTKYSEGISNSILEYMGAGIVAIATNIGATKEIIENKINGILIQPGNVLELVHNIELLKKENNLVSGIVTNAKKTLKNKFNYKENANRLVKVYKQLMK